MPKQHRATPTASERSGGGRRALDRRRSAEIVTRLVVVKGNDPDTGRPLSAEKFARALGLDAKAVQRCLRTKTAPDLQTLVDVASHPYFGCSLDWLVMGERDQRHSPPCSALLIDHLRAALVEDLSINGHPATAESVVPSPEGLLANLRREYSGQVRGAVELRIRRCRESLAMAVRYQWEAANRRGDKAEELELRGIEDKLGRADKGVHPREQSGEHLAAIAAMTSDVVAFATRYQQVRWGRQVTLREALLGEEAD